MKQRETEKAPKKNIKGFSPIDDNLYNVAEGEKNMTLHTDNNELNVLVEQIEVWWTLLEEQTGYDAQLDRSITNAWQVIGRHFAPVSVLLSPYSAFVPQEGKCVERKAWSPYGA